MRGIEGFEADEAIRIAERQAEQDGVHDAEDRRRRGDAQRQRERRDQKESGGLPQQPSAVANIEKQGAHCST
jgi:hypothetical protein